MPTISYEQKTTAAGILGTTALAFLFSDRIPADYIVAGAISFGTGVAMSNGFYRVAELLKNGKAESNQFGKGLLAGLSLFCGLVGVKSIPYICKMLTKAPFSLNTQSVLLALGIFGIIGFLQNRNSYLTFIENEDQ
jgi:hypothetical protein